jgi:hypothetical protein
MEGKTHLTSAGGARPARRRARRRPVPPRPAPPAAPPSPPLVPPARPSPAQGSRPSGNPDPAIFGGGGTGGRWRVRIDEFPPGAATSPAFIDIFDGPCFTPAVCLCCAAAVSAAAAREAAASLRLFRRYFDPRGYAKSPACARANAACTRDVRPEEAAEVQRYVSELSSTSDALREANATPGIAIAIPSCRPGVLWIYSTPNGRRLVRHLTREAGAVIGPPPAAPRFRFALFAVEGTTPLIDAALAWIRAGQPRTA